MHRKLLNILIALLIIALVPLKVYALPERITITDIGNEPNTYYSGYNKCNTSACKSGSGKSSSNTLPPDIYNAYTTDGRLISDAYCLDPGTPFGSETAGYVLSDKYYINSCMNSNDSYECAMAGVFYKAQEKNYWQYIIINNAVRLVQARYGKMNSINAYGRARVNIFTKTSQFLDNGNAYSGLNPNTDYILYTNSENAQYLKAAAEIYKEVMTGFSFNRKTATKPNNDDKSSSYDETRKILTLVAETDFEENEISSLLINSDQFGNLTPLHSHEVRTCDYNNSKKCIYVTMPYDKTNVVGTDNISIDLIFDGKEDIASSIGLYTYVGTNNNRNSNKFQRFVIYDKSFRKNISLKYPIYREEQTICTIKNGKYYGQNGNYLGTGTTGYEAYKKECKCYRDPETGQYYINWEDGPVSYNRWKQVCNPTTTCNTKPKYNMPGDCEKDGSEGTISDPSICSIMSDEKSKNNYKIDKYSNEYCDVYCRETLNFTFMDKETAFAGRYFKHSVASKYSKIEYLSTVILSSRQCFSVTNYDKWKNDYIAANDKVRTSWNTYKKWEAYYDLKSGKPTSTESGGGCTGCKGSRRDVSNFVVSWDNAQWSETNSYGSTSNQKQTVTQRGSSASCGYTFCKACPPPPAASSTSWSETNDEVIVGTKPVFENVDSSAVIQVASGCECGSVCRGSLNSASSANTNYVTTKYTDAKSDYNNKVTRRNDLVNKINSCNFVDGSDTYVGILGTKLNNKVNIDYDENRQFNMGYDISIANTETSAKVVKRGYGSSNDYYSYCSDCYGTASMLSENSVDEHLTYWTCSGSGLSASCYDDTNKLFPTNKVSNIVVERESQHYQNAQFYAKVLTGEVSTNKGSGYWLTLEKNIYPVSIKTPSGNYGITVDYSNNTDNRKVTFKPGEFTCSYDVINNVKVYECPEPPCNDTIGEGGTLGLYMRTIDLTDMFPNESGTTSSKRDYGINWKTGKGPIVQKEIEELGNEVWTKKTPRYSITLTPSMINSIKKYNNDNSYFDYSLSCGESNSNPLYCKSYFLTDYLKPIMGDKYNINYDSTINTKLTNYYYKNSEVTR